MDPERSRQIEELFHAALEHEPSQRYAFLGEACQGDEELKREIESLLARERATELFHPGGEQGPFEPGATEWLASGTHLGPYCVEAPVGAGGMGQVYRASDTRLRRTVAIKVLPRHESSYAERKRRFLQEAQAASALNHPNIVVLHDIASDRGVDFLVMEYVDGRTLKDLISGTSLPLNEVSDYGAQVASALAAAHAAGIVHRDIKPANIMITPESQVKVLDFGVAKLMERSVANTKGETRTIGPARTEPGMLVGTVSYMSPEQTRGEPLDGRSDIFSLGCVLYEAATGLLPFQGPSTLSVVHQIATGNPPAPSALRPDLPVEFDLLIERALAKDKDQRYASSLELAEALKSLRVQVAPAAPAATKREPSTFVGRELEVHRLQELLRNAVQGSGRTVFLTGEPGIGKSALAEAFLIEAKHDSPELLIGRGTCVEQYGAGEAYLPFLDALSGLLSNPSRERVLGVLRRHAPTWCLQLPTAFASPSAFEQLQRETIGATKERMLREFGDALGALASGGPVVLLLEDLHWADSASIDLLRHLAPRAGGQRLLLIGTFRPEDVERSNHPLKNCKREIEAHNLCDEIALRLLPSEHLATYLDVRFAPNDFPPELPGLIYRKTEGHPLFSAALIELLQERGDISRSDAGWTLTHPISELGLEVPESVRGVIRRKIEALDGEDRRTLQYASIQGEEFTSTIVAGMLGADELALEQRLARLDRVHHLIETRGEEDLPDGALATKYHFAHALYQNILYEDLLLKQRVMLHRQAGEHLARHYGDQTARVAVALATHFERGRDYPRAIEYLIQAARVASERYAGAAADEDYSRALRLVEKLPLAEQKGKQIGLIQQRGTVRLAMGSLADAENDFNVMLDLARAIEDQEYECMALNALANPFFTMNVPQRSDEMSRAENALRVAQQTGNPALRAEAIVNLALRHSVVGEPAIAKSLFEAAIPLARSSGHDRALLSTLTYRGVGHFFQTEYRGAEEMLSEASELASRLRDGVILRTALFFLGWTQASLGRMSDALATLHHVLEMAERNGDRNFLSRAQKRIRWIHWELQGFPHTMQHSQAGAETTVRSRPDEVADSPINLIHIMYETERGGDQEKGPAEMKEWHFSGVRVQAGAAESALSQGDLKHAEEQALALLDNSLRHGPPKYLAVAHKILAETAMARGDLANAEQELAAALEPFRTNPAPLVAWKTYAALGRLHRLKNDAQAARKAYGCAAEIVRKIASNVDDEQLRSTFLNAPAVQEVVRGSL